MGSRTTGFNWASYLREYPAVVLANQPAKQMGGPGKCVEIDESYIRSRKYSTGRILKSEAVWVFGSICCETGDCFVVPCEKRIAATLLLILQTHVAPGSTIYSDQWRAMGASTTFPKAIDTGVSTTRKTFYLPATLQFIFRLWKGCGIV